MDDEQRAMSSDDEHRAARQDPAYWDAVVDERDVYAEALAEEHEGEWVERQEQRADG